MEHGRLRERVMYKYCRREHSAGMLKAGSVKIGTLLGFRDQEGLGPNIGDELEGRILSGDRPRQLPPGGLSGYIGTACDGSSAIVQDCEFGVADAYIFSLATELSADAARRWLQDPKANYDAAYQVTDIVGFARALAQGLARIVGPLNVTGDRVGYYKRIEPDWAHFSRIEYAKPDEFTWQTEYRIVLKPMHNIASFASEVLEIPELCQFVAPAVLPAR